MAIWAWVLVAVAIVIVVAVIAVALANRRTRTLRQHFGSEYDRTMQEREGRRAAESDLRNRQKQRSKLTIHPLPEPTRARYAEQWRELQERFIDQPSSAVLAADALVRQVMDDEGYPVENFNEQSDLVSVDHPRVVENYRLAHGVYERTQTQQASTEDMRTALLSYRSLFDELLSAGHDGADGDRGHDRCHDRPRPAPGPQESTDGGAR